jgi:hypothetical protein
MGASAVVHKLPDDWRPLGLGNVHYYRHDYDRAIACYDQVLASDLREAAFVNRAMYFAEIVVPPKSTGSLSPVWLIVIWTIVMLSWESLPGPARKLSPWIPSQLLMIFRQLCGDECTDIIAAAAMRNGSGRKNAPIHLTQESRYRASNKPLSLARGLRPVCRTPRGRRLLLTTSRRGDLSGNGGAVDTIASDCTCSCSREVRNCRPPSVMCQPLSSRTTNESPKISRFGASAARRFVRLVQSDPLEIRRLT